jgi:hypothetical protein
MKQSRKFWLSKMKRRLALQCLEHLNELPPIVKVLRKDAFKKQAPYYAHKGNIVT